MSDERDYYYTDGPSPLHEARDAVQAKRRGASKIAEALAERVGAKSAVGTGRISGFVFDGKPDPNRWTKLRVSGPGGVAVWAPKKNTKEGKSIAATMHAIEFPEHSAILAGTGLDRMVVSGRYLIRSGVGWYGDRIFVTVPNANECGGDPPAVIPNYLTPCKRWEMEKFADEYAAEKAEATA